MMQLFAKPLLGVSMYAFYPEKAQDDNKEDCSRRILYRAITAVVSACLMVLTYFCCWTRITKNNACRENDQGLLSSVGFQ